jgi:hypothetical protein
VLPAPAAVATVATGTIVILFEAWLRTAAQRIMMILCLRQRFARDRIAIEGAILLPTCPAPRPSTTSAHVELIILIQATGKHIVAGGIFESPPPTPGALLCVRCADFLGHFLHYARGYV